MSDILTRILTRALLLLVLVAATPSSGSADALVQGLDAMLGKVEELRSLRSKRLAVGEFPTTDRRSTELGVHVADQIEVVLAQRAGAAGFEIVTRSHICQVIRQNRLRINDLFDAAIEEKLGKFVLADALAAGTVTDLGRRFAISVRLLDTATGKILWAGSLSVAADDALRALLSRSVSNDECIGAAAVVPLAPGASPAPLPPGTPAPAGPVITPSPAAPAPPVPDDGPHGSLRVQVWTDKPLYRVGDRIQFGLRVNRDAYVTLVNIGTGGSVTVIYPNRYHPDHFVRAGQDVTIPPPGARFVLSVKGPPGFEQVRAIATEEPVKVHTGTFTTGGQPFRVLDRAQTRGLAVELKEGREKVEPGKWAEAVVAVEVLAQRP